MPVVQFRSEEPRLQVYLSATKAAGAAQNGPEDEFYDVRGIALTRGDSGDGSLRLEARGDGDADELQQRLMTELRRAAVREAHDGSPAAEAEAVLGWLAAAPGPEYIVHALSIAEPDDDGTDDTDDETDLESRPCRGCNWIQRWVYGSPPCCPG